MENQNKRLGYKSVIIGFLIATLLLAGIVSLFASANPDGLEWSIGKVARVEELEGDTNIHDKFAEAQEKTAILPGYSFKKSGNDVKSNSVDSETMGTIVSGIVGSAVTIGIIVLIGYYIKFAKRKRLKKSE